MARLEARAVEALLDSGRSWDEINNMTPYQLKFILAGMAVRAKREERLIREAKSKARYRRR